MITNLLRRVSGTATPPRLFDPREYSLSIAELDLLRTLIREVADTQGPIVEIGTLVGRTTTEIAIADEGRHQVITVDNYCWNNWGFSAELHSAVAEQMLRYLTATERVQRVQRDKSLFFESYAGPAPSLVFLDAMHTYEETKIDIDWARSVQAGVICGHDYSREFPGVMQIIDELGGPRRLSDSLWVL